MHNDQHQFVLESSSGYGQDFTLVELHVYAIKNALSSEFHDQFTGLQYAFSRPFLTVHGDGFRFSRHRSDPQLGKSDRKDRVDYDHQENGLDHTDGRLPSHALGTATNAKSLEASDSRNYDGKNRGFANTAEV